MPDGPQITVLLQQWRSGDRDAQDKLLPLLYPEMKKIAASYMRSENPGHTLQPTALIHEAYVKLLNQRADWAGRSHFYGIAAQVMRRILADHARRRRAQRHGGEALRVGEELAFQVPEVKRNPDAAELDDALTELEKFDPRQGRVVELRYFGGLSVEETAEVLDISPATVKRDWQMARTWLKKELLRRGASGASA